MSRVVIVGWQPYRHLWTDCPVSVGASRSHDPIGLHGLLRGYLFTLSGEMCIIFENAEKTFEDNVDTYILSCNWTEGYVCICAIWSATNDRMCHTDMQSPCNWTKTVDRHAKHTKLEYLDVTVLRRGIGEVRVVAGRAPACWQVWRGMQYKEKCFYNWTRDVCSHWKQTNR
jgi:hypothetical protein